MARPNSMGVKFDNMLIGRIASNSNDPIYEPHCELHTPHMTRGTRTPTPVGPEGSSVLPKQWTHSRCTPGRKVWECSMGIKRPKFLPSTKLPLAASLQAITQKH
eukprot:TRINITY_DN698_c2_g1_i2.p1 TRINITY_DN698_c2_g1~~TRINITY_DN698_c2_g1_i2.p1  ORF type:complete len:104 (-),score=5.18 TRINITY_DN698_c2_g1_i2:224-535(-)